MNLHSAGGVGKTGRSVTELLTISKDVLRLLPVLWGKPFGGADWRFHNTGKKEIIEIPQTKIKTISFLKFPSPNGSSSWYPDD